MVVLVLDHLLLLQYFCLDSCSIQLLLSRLCRHYKYVWKNMKLFAEPQCLVVLLLWYTIQLFEELFETLL